jgi:hypothetical protein
MTGFMGGRLRLPFHGEVTMPRPVEVIPHPAEDDQHKPAFWWATDLEPWKRTSAKLRTPADRHLQKLEGVVLSTLALFDVAITSAATVNEGDWE